MTGFLYDVGTILYREILRYKRERVYLVGQVLLPLLAVVFVGLPVRGMGAEGNYVTFLASGLMMLTISSGAIGGGYTLLEDVQQGFLRPILVAPITRTSIVVGKILARLFLSLFLVIVMILIFSLFTDLNLAHPLLALGALSAVTFGFVALGILLATSLRSMESFRFLAVFITLPVYLLSGMLFPVAAMPPPMQFLARMNPLTYGVDLFRYGLTHVHEFGLWLDGLVLLVFAVFSTLLAARAFERRLAS
jgi:ABC-2 type transport system permease protein